MNISGMVRRDNGVRDDKLNCLLALAEEEHVGIIGVAETWVKNEEANREVDTWLENREEEWIWFGKRRTGSRSKNRQ